MLSWPFCRNNRELITVAINARLIRNARSSLAALLLFAVTTVSAQDVAEIPLFNAPEGTAALGGGIRLGQNMYLASDNEDERKLDLIPMYLYEGRYLFFRGTMGFCKSGCSMYISFV